MRAHSGVVEFGGTGAGILLLHGLMGRARTWWSVAQWLVRYGRVVGLDARAHGRHPDRRPCRTEQFAADAADVICALDLGPVSVIGHSMGGLHALALAADYPDLVRAVVVEDFAPDQRGRTVRTWQPYCDSWPEAFQALAHVRQFFGAQGDYFVECVEERADGYHLIADLPALYEIAAEWGQREYWSFVVRARAPMLLIEAEHSAMPAGQMAEMASRARDAKHLVVAGAGHVVHDDQPAAYRAAVEGFLAEHR